MFEAFCCFGRIATKFTVLYNELDGAGDVVLLLFENNTLNRGTKGGGSIFIQAEHFPQITGRLTIAIGRGDRHRSGHHARERQDDPEAPHRGDSALWVTTVKKKKEKTQKTGY